MRQQLAQQITDMIQPLVASDGYELVHVEVVGQSGATVLRVYIDKPGGVTVDDCAHVSNHVSVLLDVEDPIPTRYLLEVCSPGLERGLYKQTDYQRFVGRDAKIQTWDQVAGRRTFHGELLGIDSDMVTIRERILGQDVHIPYQQIRKANLVFDWNKQKS